MDPKIQEKLQYALDVEETIANLLAKGLEDLILTKEGDLDRKIHNRLLEILNQIKKDTEEHLLEIEAMVNLK